MYPRFMRTFLQHTVQRVRSLIKTEPEACDFALILSGGGARSSYQAGVLKYIAEAFPTTSFPFLTGVSAGAINTSHLSNHTGDIQAAAEHLVESWISIRAEEVFHSESTFAFVRGALFRGKSQAEDQLAHRQGLLDTAPLRDYLRRKLGTKDGYLHGVAENLRAGRLKAYAIITTNYNTNQTVTWLQGRDIKGWERPNRVGINTRLSVDHIMASTALPLLFPAVKIGAAWYGDGGIRLSAPLAPAVHMGADRILAISTRYDRSQAEADTPSFVGYPATSQIIGTLMNAIFLDVMEQDALMMHRINQLLETVPRSKWNGFRPIRLLMLRPSKDLGQLASQYEPKFTGAIRLLTMGLGSDETKSPDWLSMLLFERSYIENLIEIGYEDAQNQHEKLEEFLDPGSDYRWLHRWQHLFND